MPHHNYPYLGSPPERMLITIDVGNTFCSLLLNSISVFATDTDDTASLTITHLRFGHYPQIRTVTRFPGQILPSSRVPSCVMYDLREQPRAFGAEALSTSVTARAKNDNWTLVNGFKSQMLPDSNSLDTGPLKAIRNRLARRSKTPENLGAMSSPSTLSLASLNLHGGAVPFAARAVTPEHLTEAWTGEEVSTPEWANEGKSRKKEKDSRYQGPLLKLIYADHLKHLIACVRAWFGEVVPEGEEIFMRCWDECTFVITSPADWGPNETDILREAMQLAKLLPSTFAPGRLVFVKEPASIVYFAKRHTRECGSSWLEPGRSFALCDSAEAGTSIIGYTVTALEPLLKLRAYDPVSRLQAGAGAVSSAFRAHITKRLAKSKFRAPEHAASIMEQFEAKIKTKFASSSENFSLKFAEEGSDTGVGIRDGWLAVSGSEVEDAFKPVVDAIIVRLSSVLPRGGAKSILVAGGFGESPYLQYRLRETFETQGVAVIVPDIPTHNAVSEGAARFYLAETILPRPLRYAFGTSTAVDWSSHWAPGMEKREIFTSVTGKRFLTGAWSEMLPAGTLFEPDQAFRRPYNVKYVLEKGDPTFSLDIWGWRRKAPSTAPQTNGDAKPNVVWMIDQNSQPKPDFNKIGTVSADLSPLVPLLPRNGEGSATWVQLNLEVLIYLGTHGLEACVAWQEKEIEKRGTPLLISSDWF